jgi:hypothetical protein
MVFIPRWYIFFHNGIVIYAKYKIKVDIGDKNKKGIGEVSEEDPPDNDSWDEGEGEWAICKAMNKDSSTYRVILWK